MIGYRPLLCSGPAAASVATGFFIWRTSLHRPCLPNLSAPHLHRREVPATTATRVQADQVAKVENLSLRPVTDHGDLARYLVVF